MRANFVGRSVVSAMTQTPASGPFGPVTTPPMSSASMATAVWARSWAGARARSPATPIAATLKYSLVLSLIGALLVDCCRMAPVAISACAGSPMRFPRVGRDSAQSPRLRNGVAAGGTSFHRSARSPYQAQAPRTGNSHVEAADRIHSASARPRGSGAPHQVRLLRRAHQLFLLRDVPRGSLDRRPPRVQSQ